MEDVTIMLVVECQFEDVWLHLSFLLKTELENIVCLYPILSTL